MTSTHDAFQDLFAKHKRLVKMAELETMNELYNTTLHIETSRPFWTETKHDGGFLTENCDEREIVQEEIIHHFIAFLDNVAVTLEKHAETTDQGDFEYSLDFE